MGRRIRRAAHARQVRLNADQLAFAQGMNAIWARMEAIPKGWTPDEYKPVVVSEYVTPRGAPRNVEERRRGALDPTVRQSRAGGRRSGVPQASARQGGSAPHRARYEPEQERIVSVKRQNEGLLEIYRNPDGSMFCIPSDLPPEISPAKALANKRSQREDMTTAQLARMTPPQAAALPEHLNQRWRNIVANSAALVGMTPKQWLAQNENASPAGVYALYADSHASPMHKVPSLRKPADMTPDSMLKIVQKNGRALAGVPESGRTKEICMAALTSKQPAMFRDVPKHLQREVGEAIIARMHAGKSVPMPVQAQLSWSWQKVFPDQAKPDILVRSIASRAKPAAPKAQASAGNGRPARPQGQGRRRGQAPQSRPSGRRPEPLVPVRRSAPIRSWDQAHAQAFDNSGLMAAADGSVIRHRQDGEGQTPTA